MVRLTDAERARIDEAVAAAERETSGEIVTVVAARSDAYHDAALHWAVLAMLAVPALSAALPGAFQSLLDASSGGWGESHPLPFALLVLTALMALVFLLVRYALAWAPARLALTPKATRARRVRRRAEELFRVSTERRTLGATGVLVYLSLAEHRAELVADAAIAAKVSPETWGEAMTALVQGARAGRLADGLAGCIAQVGAVLAQHFPPDPDNPNELPDRLIEL